VSTGVAAVRSDLVADAADQQLSPSAARAALGRLCAAGFVEYCSYSICRAPLLPLFAVSSPRAHPSSVLSWAPHADWSVPEAAGRRAFRSVRTAPIARRGCSSRRCPSAILPCRRSRGSWYSGSFMAARRRSSARSRPQACPTLRRLRGVVLAEYVLHSSRGRPGDRTNPCEICESRSLWRCSWSSCI
jgi:hypothetical protein